MPTKKIKKAICNCNPEDKDNFDKFALKPCPVCSTKVAKTETGQTILTDIDIADPPIQTWTGHVLHCPNCPDGLIMVGMEGCGKCLTPTKINSPAITAFIRKNTK